MALDSTELVDNVPEIAAQSDYKPQQKQLSPSHAYIYTEGEFKFKKLPGTTAVHEQSVYTINVQANTEEAQRQLLRKITRNAYMALNTIRAHALSVMAGISIISIILSLRLPANSTDYSTMFTFLRIYAHTAFGYTRIIDVLLTINLVLTTRDLLALLRVSLSHIPDRYSVQVVLMRQGIAPISSNTTLPDPVDDISKYNKRSLALQSLKALLVFFGLGTAYIAHLLLFQIDDSIWLSTEGQYGGPYGSQTWFTRVSTQNITLIHKDMTRWCWLTYTRNVAVIVSWLVELLLDGLLS